MSLDFNKIIAIKCLWNIKTAVYLPSQSSNGLVVQLVRIPACHAGGREFESRPDRKLQNSSKKLGLFFVS